MTTASDGVAVIATQVARTDRRALSEAWYSALHLAHAPALPRSGTARRISVAPSRVSDAANARGPAPRELAVAPPRVSPPHADGTRAESAADRRRPACEVTRRIERAVVVLSARRPVPAAHTVDVAGGRVRLLVHTDGRTTRIVAVCSSPLREPVERALASARFALAGAGHEVAAP